MDGGCVILVGAGPGDPRLMTVRAQFELERADAVVYDRLIHPNLLEAVRPEAQLFYVGKIPGQLDQGQEAINELLAHLAGQGHRVVRLKGGDPFLFGRGGEEAEFLRARQIPFEVVPGIPSPIGALAYAGIPVTHRGVSQGMTVVHGYRGRIEAPGLADERHTWVVLMGIEHIERWVEKALADGVKADCPAAVIEWGTWGDQKTVESVIKDLPQMVYEQGIRSPAVVVLGNTVKHIGRLGWWHRRLLSGERFVVVEEQTGDAFWADTLRQHGAEVIHWPVFQEPRMRLDWIEEESARPGGVVLWLTKPSSVGRVTGLWRARGQDVRRLPEIGAWARCLSALADCGLTDAPLWPTFESVQTWLKQHDRIVTVYSDLSDSKQSAVAVSPLFFEPERRVVNDFFRFHLFDRPCTKWICTSQEAAQVFWETVPEDRRQQFQDAPVLTTDLGGYQKLKQLGCHPVALNSANSLDEIIDRFGQKHQESHGKGVKA